MLFDPVHRALDIVPLANAPSGVKILAVDIQDTAAASQVLAGACFDAVVDWIAFRPADIERDVALFRGRTRQFVFISSASVYQKPVSHYLITESTPLANPYWEYALQKIACEARLMRACQANAPEDTMKLAPGLYQYTYVDDCTRYLVAALYPRRSLSAPSATAT